MLVYILGFIISTLIVMAIFMRDPKNRDRPFPVLMTAIGISVSITMLRIATQEHLGYFFLSVLTVLISHFTMANLISYYIEDAMEKSYLDEYL